MTNVNSGFKSAVAGLCMTAALALVGCGSNAESATTTSTATSGTTTTGADATDAGMPLSGVPIEVRRDPG